MTELAETLGILIACTAAIWFACEFFTNGVEWLGRALSLSQTATGTILAAFGTALPETIVTLVAVAFTAGASAKAIGVGAALGGPLVLSTLAYSAVGIAFLLGGMQIARTEAMRAQFRRLSRDQTWFLTIFAAKIGLGVVAFAGKAYLGWLFLAAYGLYARLELKGTPDEEVEALAPLRIAPRLARPPLWLILVQTGAALAVIFEASRLFVGGLEKLSPMMGMRPQLAALLLSPIATELPELLNALIWVRQGKHRLALANISGAMMIQATVPTACGLLFTPWLLDAPLLAGAAATAVATGAMAMAFRQGFLSRRLLAAMGLVYVAFAVVLVTFRL